MSGVSVMALRKLVASLERPCAKAQGAVAKTKPAHSSTPMATLASAAALGDSRGAKPARELMAPTVAGLWVAGRRGSGGLRRRCRTTHARARGGAAWTAPGPRVGAVSY